MSLRAEQVVKSNKPEGSSAQMDGRSSSQRHIISPEPKQAPTPEPQQQQDTRSEKQRREEVKKEERQEPDGRQADTTITEQKKEVCELKPQEPINKQLAWFEFALVFTVCLSQVRDVWYEAGTVWYVHKDGFTRGESLSISQSFQLKPRPVSHVVRLMFSNDPIAQHNSTSCCRAVISATQLKPDEGTPELPDGRVRVRLQTDASPHDVTEHEMEKVLQLTSSSSSCDPVCLSPSILRSVTHRSWICVRTWATCRVWTSVEFCTRWPAELKPTCRSRTPGPTWSTSGLRCRRTARCRLASLFLCKLEQVWLSQRCRFYKLWVLYSYSLGHTMLHLL